MALQGSVGEIRTNKEHFSLKNVKKLRTASLKQNLLVLTKKELKTPLGAASNSLKPFKFKPKTNIGDINSSSSDDEEGGESKTDIPAGTRRPGDIP